MDAPGKDVVDTSAQVQGLKIRLRSLTPAVVSELANKDRMIKVLPEEFTKIQHEAYKLGLYDVLTVAVWEHPELSMPLGQYRSDVATGQMVDETGSIFYPYIGSLPAHGLTANELRQRLVLALSKILNNPQLDVKITGFRSQKAYVHGGVAKPGVVPLTDVPLTLLDAITQAGGLASNGEGCAVELVRDGKLLKIDLYANYGNGVDPSRLLLKNGDVVRVPSKEESKIYLLGEVEKVQGLALNNGRMSLAQALTEAGGLSPLAAAGKGVYVARLRDSTSVDLFHLDARNPLALALGDQFSLKPHDIVWVDATGLARWNRVVNLLAPSVGLYNSLMQSVYYTKGITE
jgi:polysaccharide export outer membrane protein